MHLQALGLEARNGRLQANSESHSENALQNHRTKKNDYCKHTRYVDIFTKRVVEQGGV